jgi:hypothetical protein
LPFIPKRPPALAHVSEDAAARALSSRFGSVAQAAKDLGVRHGDLGQLIRHNPAILDAAHERMSFFIFVRRDEIISGLSSKVASVRRRAIDRMAANPALFGDLFAGGLSLLAPAARARGPSHSAAAVDEARLAQERLEREAAAELAFEGERERALADARERDNELILERERGAVMVERRPSAPTPASTVSLWPSYIRRPTRGRRW